MMWFKRKATRRQTRDGTGRGCGLSLERLEDRTLLDAGFLDPTFGSGGRVLTDFTGSLDDSALTAARLPDGKLLVLGYAAHGAVVNEGTGDFALVQYNSDGNLDTSFGTRGLVRSDIGFPFNRDLPAAMHLQPDGKILVAALVRASAASGVPSLVLAGFNANGTFNSAFGTGGKIVRETDLPFTIGSDAITTTVHVSFQADGKIVVAGNPERDSPGSTVARFLADGTPDSSFGSGGRVTTRVGGGLNLRSDIRVIQQPDDKLLLVGGRSSPFLIRYNPDGSLDTGFGNGGFVRTQLDTSGLGVTLQADGKIVVVGAIGSDFLVARYTTAGAFDPGFGTNGQVRTAFPRPAGARAASVQADEKIVVAGTMLGGVPPLMTEDFALARYNADGTLDAGFGTGGTLTTDFAIASRDQANGVLVLADGKIVAVGKANRAGGDFALARYNSDGSLDATFAGSGMVVTDIEGPRDNFARGVAVQANGKFVVVGGSSNGVFSDFALARYLRTGELDPTFGDGGRVMTRFEAASRANVVAIQADGRIVAAGSHDRASALARYNADGSLDGTFGVGGRVTFATISPAHLDIHSVAVQPNGKLLVAGACGLVRLNTDGSLDASFGTGGTVRTCDGQVRDRGTVRAALQADGKIVIAAERPDDRRVVVLERYNSNGSPDTSFGVAGSVVTSVGQVLGRRGPGLRLDPDGKILVAGAAQTTSFLSSGDLSLGIARYSPDGSPDTTFGISGRTVLDLAGRDSPVDLLIQSDGKIVVVGLSGAFNRNSYTGLVVTRLLPNGALNTSFGVVGKISVAAPSLFDPAVQAALLPEGKLAVVGTAPGTGTGNDFFVTGFNLNDNFTTANQRYVGQLYFNLLGRSADAGGLNGFVGLLDQSQATRAQVAQLITDSDEYRSILVKDVYRTLLNREADPGGLNQFVSFLRASGTVAQLKAVLLGSAEYAQNRGGGTNDGFVTALYRDVLGRTADAGGRQFFNQVLTAGAPRTAAAGLIVASRENLERITQGWFRQYLRRSADAGGLNGFATFLAMGGREETAIASFLSSGEFTAGL